MNNPLPRTATLLPPNATRFERNLATVNARIDEIQTPLADLMNPYTIRADLLPWLAWHLGVDHWKEYWPKDVKRARVAAAIPIARKKGTAAAVRDAVMNIKDSRLLFTPLDPGRTVSGQGAGCPTITRADVDQHRYYAAQRESYTAVRAYWHSNASGKRQSVLAGKQDRTNLKVLPDDHASETEMPGGSRGKTGSHAA
ncbi:MAG: phage tail protein I [Janthinobacterium lividum]